MNEINKNRFEVTTRDLRGLGSIIEKCLSSIKESDYGFYKIENYKDLEIKLALKIIEGMNEFQEQNNKGVRMSGTFNNTLEIYNLNVEQEKMDEAMGNFII